MLPRIVFAVFGGLPGIVLRVFCNDALSVPRASVAFGAPPAWAGKDPALWGGSWAPGGGSPDRSSRKPF